MYSYRKAILPIEAELGNDGEPEGSASEIESDEELDSYMKKIKKLRDNLFSNLFLLKNPLLHCILKDLGEGTLVWLRNSARDGRKGYKLSKRWLGPYS